MGNKAEYSLNSVTLSHLNKGKSRLRKMMGMKPHSYILRDSRVVLENPEHLIY